MISSSLYLHIPFCSRKCLFCSFVIAVGQEHRREEYIKSLIVEMKKYRSQNISTIYFGGGTPSVLEENHFDELMREIKNNCTCNDDVEITIEANPESITRPKAKFLKSIGVTRISLGVQSMNDRYLKFLGRNHDAKLATDTFHMLREEGFKNINLDLMYAFPGQTAEELEEDVRAIASMGSEHLSLYTLTIEPRSRFFATEMKLDEEETLARHYVTIGQLLNEYGFNQYEVSNFSKPGHESKHNSNYWLGSPYIGLGIGAHGFDGRRRYWNTSNLQEYLQKTMQGQETIEGFEDLTDEQLQMEKVIFGLRMNKGIPMDIVPANRHELIETWIKDGFLLRQGTRVKVSDRGRLILDELSSRLI